MPRLPYPLRGNLPDASGDKRVEVGEVMHIPPTPEEVFDLLSAIEKDAPQHYPAMLRFVSEYGRRTERIRDLLEQVSSLAAKN